MNNDTNVLLKEEKDLSIDILVDSAYEIAKDNFKDKQFTFSSIWSKTWKNALDFKKEKVEDWIGVFYTELLLDSRFINYSNNVWRLKEFMDYAEYKKLEKNIILEDSSSEEELKVESNKDKKEILDEEENQVLELIDSEV